MTPMTPVKPMDVVERLSLINAETKRIKESGAPYAIEQMISSNPVPPALLAAIGRMAAQQRKPPHNLFRIPRLHQVQRVRTHR
jgi:hypothetical protein